MILEGGFPHIPKLALRSYRLVVPLPAEQIQRAYGTALPPEPPSTNISCQFNLKR